MAPSEYEQYLEQAPNKRGDWPDQVDWIRDTFYEKNTYDKRIYDKKSNSSNSDKEPQFSGPGGWLYCSTDACQYQVNPTIPQIIQTPRLSLGDRPPQIPAYLRPSVVSHIRPNPENARRYHEKQEEVEDLMRKVAGIRMDIDDTKRHSRYPRSHFQPMEDQIEDLKKQINKVEKEEKKLRQRSNKEVIAQGGNVDYGHRKAAGEIVPKTYHRKDGREAKKRSRRMHRQFRNG